MDIVSSGDEPKNQGPGGDLAAVVIDQGQGGSGQGDILIIEFFGGIYAGRYDCGVLQGGNLEVTNH